MVVTAVDQKLRELRTLKQHYYPEVREALTKMGLVRRIMLMHYYPEVKMIMTKMG